MIASDAPRRARGFEHIRRAETAYARALRKIARQIGELINAVDFGDPSAVLALEHMLERYSDLITPWAKAAAERMLAEVAQRSQNAWLEHARNMSKALQSEIRRAPTGEVMRRLQAEQVTLIKSLPLDAAKRVHEWALRGMENGTRAAEVAEQIRRSGMVSANRAMLIARTETARASSVLTQARAEHVGSEFYIWRTVGDSDVRPSHRKMEGKVARWDRPPTLSDGTVTPPGCIYNCRCYPEPVLPEMV